MASSVHRTRGARSRLLAALTVAALCGSAEGAAPDRQPQPAKLLPAIHVIAAEPVRVVWPAAGLAVHAPAARATVVPGQGIALAVAAEGEGRDALLRGATFTYRLHAAGKETVVGPQRADAIKAIEAEGADFAVEVLGAASVADADRKKIEEAVGVVALVLHTDPPDRRRLRRSLARGRRGPGRRARGAAAAARQRRVPADCGTMSAPGRQPPASASTEPTPGPHAGAARPRVAARQGASGAGQPFFRAVQGAWHSGQSGP
jgi:hypothetical protein